MDVVSRIKRLGKKRFLPPLCYHYHKPMNVVRNAVVLLTFATLVIGIVFVAVILDPFSAYGRFFSYIFNPLVHNTWDPGALIGCGIAVLTMIVVTVLAWRRGRLWCNTICPVGSTLGYVSRHAVMRIDIDTDKCIQCRRCEWVCKTECIDLTSHVVDGSRCVNCFNCIGVCPNDAIHYTYTRKQLSIPMMQRVASPGGAVATMNRRTFLVMGAGGCAALASAKLPSGHDAQVQTLTCLPPGIPGRELFMSRCTGCGLCVSQCPTKVLRPSYGQLGILNVLHPMMNYDKGWCTPDCNRCSQVCPSGAIMRLTLREKNRFIIGTASVDESQCISAEGLPCGLCSDACPYYAITMKSLGGKRKLPVVDPGVCVGCGACQNSCPARPVRAIKVNALP